MDEEERDHLRIDDVVVIMIPVRLRGRLCGTALRTREDVAGDRPGAMQASGRTVYP